MATEYPPLGKSYVSGYANNDRSYPIISIRKDPRVDSYKIPDDLSAHPDSTRYPNHVFTGAQPTRSDERVEWVYEILPGPWVPFTRYDENLGPIQGRRRAVANTGQTASLATTQKKTYEGRDGSAIVSLEIEENWSDGSGSETNPSFPINTRDLYDPSRGAVQESRQLIVPTGNEVGTLENINGTITQTTYEPYNEFLVFKVVQTYKVSGPQLIGSATDNDGQLVTVTTQRKAAGGYVPPQPTATKTVEAQREDAETVVERIIDTPEVFPAKSFSASKPDVLPEQFRASVPAETTQETVAQNSVSMPSLASNEIEKSEQQITKFTARKTTVTRDNSELPILRGQDYESSVNIIIPYEEKITPSGQSLDSAATFVDPLSEDLDLVRTINLNAVKSELDAVFLSFPTRTSLSLPKILKSVSIIWDGSKDDASFSSDFEGFTSGTSGSLSGSESGRASSQASVSPAFVVDMEEIYANNIPTTSYFFFLPYPVKLEDILTKVGGGVAAWPIFKPASHVLAAFGESARVSVEGSASASSSFSPTSSSFDRTTGKGGSYARGQQTVTITIPPSIHGSISIQNSGTKNYSGVASFNIGWAGSNFPSVFVSDTKTVEVNGTGPTSIPSVSGPTDIPRSGLYLIDSRVEIYQYGYARIYAEVLDASIFA
jgi:hypothetical protein